MRDIDRDFLIESAAAIQISDLPPLEPGRGFYALLLEQPDAALNARLTVNNNSHQHAYRIYRQPGWEPYNPRGDGFSGDSQSMWVDHATAAIIIPCPHFDVALPAIRGTNINELLYTTDRGLVLQNVYTFVYMGTDPINSITLVAAASVFPPGTAYTLFSS